MVRWSLLVGAALAVYGDDKSRRSELQIFVINLLQKVLSWTSHKQENLRPKKTLIFQRFEPIKSVWESNAHKKNVKPNNPTQLELKGQAPPTDDKYFHLRNDLRPIQLRFKQ